MSIVGSFSITSSSSGFGSPPATPAPATDFKLLKVVAVGENVVRLTFSARVYWSGVLDEKDGSSEERYFIQEDPASRGIDDEPARPVAVAGATLASEDGRTVDLTLDRPLSPFPAVYALWVSGLFTPEVLTGGGDMTALDGASSFNIPFYGNHRVIEGPEPDQPFRSRDIANPVWRTGAKTTNEQAFRLGTYVVDETGDYDTDEGEASLVKRIFRRLFAGPGEFLHLGNDYGVGLRSYGKRLLQAGVQQTLRVKAEQQLAREPEVAQAKVTWTQDTANPSLVRVRVLVKLRTGSVQKYESPMLMAT